MSLSAWRFNQDYWEVQGSGPLRVRKDSIEATKIYRVRWSDPDNFDYLHFIDDIVGFTTINTDGTLHREPPESHPSINFIYAQEAEVLTKGAGRINQFIDDSIDYPYAFVQVTYRALPYKVFADEFVPANDYGGQLNGRPNEVCRYVSRNPTFAAQFLSTGFGTLQFASGGLQQPTQPPALNVPEFEYTITWHEVPGNSPLNDPTTFDSIPNITIIENATGCVNYFPFDGWEQGTLLFLGLDQSKTRCTLVSTDTANWEIVYKFKIQRKVKANAVSGGVNAGPPVGQGGIVGWNYAYNPDTNVQDWDWLTGGTGFDYINLIPPNANGQYAGSLYGWYDMSKLFDLGSPSP
jgi:hypothetical protein